MIKRIARISLGFFFIVLGIAGLVLPILQGILFLAIGLLLLSVDLKIVKNFEKKVSRRFPRIGHAIYRLKQTRLFRDPRRHRH